MIKTMMGAVLPGNSTVEFKEFQVPEPGHGQVLLKTKSSTICGSDIRAIYREHVGKGQRAIRTRSQGTSRAGRLSRRGLA
jgi:D-arabinose 1-dehydrogenase-like Zn-dependent alcohol dehydrogenase